MSKLSKLNQVYIFELILFFAIITGATPRWFSFILAGLLIGYSLFASLEDASILFVRSIPFFIALPFTESFDNFNTWRIVSSIIFLRWVLGRENGGNKNPRWGRTAALLRGGAKGFLGTSLSLLLLIAILSVFVATDRGVALTRIIYFINLSLIPIVIYHLDIKERLMRNIALPVLLVTALGFIQLILTYFIDIYQFIGFWGEGIQCRQFGNAWCYIATHVGNTWFAYYGPQLSLRMFSLFTDSHTFPIFLLLGLPSLFLLKSESTRKKWWWVVICFVYLAIILSGTRGIWLASVPVFVLAMILRKFSFKNLIPFFLLFIVAWPIFTSPQFLLAHGGLFRNRVKSIFDWRETSNKARIEIWKASLTSIKHHPVLGVGIGNFPVVLAERLELSDAGSSAHNLYLHVTAEMGIFALIVLLWFLWLVLKKLYDLQVTIYFSSMLLFLPWVLAYVMTDVALFDERAFLITATVFAIILGHGTTNQHQSRLP